MQILVLGQPAQLDRHRHRFPLTDSTTTYLGEYTEADEAIAKAELVFDYLLENEPARIRHYADAPAGLTLMVQAARTQLAYLYQQASHQLNCTLIGFNGLPTLLERPILEVSLLNPTQDEARLKEICQVLQTEFLRVEDRVGMVTPRILCMIINEACYTLQEGTASVADIDQGMKLGTNYPHGPFEWANKIGIDNAYHLLQAVHDDTRDERYKVCPLLKTMYLKGEVFPVS
jgi:3-hydroxybutyryl-CoA dehydrogenase